MNEIFISYKVYNRATAIEYFKLLREKGYSVWFDQLIEKDKSWNVAIKEHIRKCKVFLCLLSQECLKDAWVLNQLKLARKFHKKIIFLAIEDINVKEFKAYKIEEYYTSFDDLDFSVLSQNNELTEYRYLVKEVNESQNHPFLLMGILLIITAYLFCYGFHFLNLHLGKEYGYLLLGLSLVVLISYIPKRQIFFVVAVGYLILLGLSLFWISPYYISEIKMNVIFLMLFFVFSLCFRYSKYGLILTMVSSILYTALALIVVFSLMLFFENMLDIDVSFINFGVLLFLLLLKYRQHINYSYIYDQYQMHKRKYFED